jgi:hypothetical protein
MLNIIGGTIWSLFILGVIFIYLKVCGIITWAWWLVTIPLWGWIVLVVGILFVCVLIAFIKVMLC